ncbi:MAG: prephenate dehydrogenase [Clostridiales bacterium]|nr:prephenate dehydrogenase [Clostridiales bacterium]
MIESSTIGFIGFGLIGGSIARAIRENYPLCTMIAYNYHTRPNQALLDAKEEGVLNEVDEDLTIHFPLCDIIFLCAPVLKNIEYLHVLKKILKPNCLLTDVGSVKGNIEEAVRTLGLSKNFIGGHPMAGSERIGYHNSNARLLENAYYILTPTKDTTEDHLSMMHAIIACTHAIPITLDSKKHDDIVAAISHLPHIIASALVNLVANNDDESNQMLSLAAGGFKDITRIASSSPAMWQNICLTNPESILKFLKLFQASVDQVSEAIENQAQEFLYSYFDSAKNCRDSIPTQKSGFISRTYEIYMDILDEAGAIASIATSLAIHHISIKNIGIIHNREFEDGVLRIELYDNTSYEKAITLLKKQNHTIYER